MAGINCRHGALSYVLIPSLSNCSDVEKSSPNFNYKNMQTIWDKITPSNGKDIHTWERIDKQEDVERLSLQCMNLHFAQSNDTPLTSDDWIS